MKLKTVSTALLALMVSVAAYAPPKSADAAEVYLIRGFANVFSRGVDQMAAQLRARGVNARAYSNGQWAGLANDIIKRSKQGKVSFPIVIAGHSVGGQEAPRFADTLAKAGVPVALVIGIDPGFAPPPPFSAGSPRVVDFWIKGSARGNPYRGTGSFAGTIENIDIRSFSNADHVGIDKDPGVQSRIVNLILASVGG